MKKPLKGKQAVLSIWKDDVWYPVLCGISCSLQSDVEEILKTTRTSGRFRERKGRLIDWGINITGLTKVDNADGQIGFFWLLINAGTEQAIRLRFTDDDANVVNVYGNVLIKQSQLESLVGGFSTATHYFPGTGVYNTDASTGVALPVLHKLYLTGTEGAFIVSHASLGGATEIMLVIREDGSYTEVSGTPVGRQFRFTDHTTYGDIIFSSSLVFNAGEVIYVQYMKP